MVEVSPRESDLIVGARTGDEDAFRSLIDPLDRELLVYCYRMLGSFHDAEDARQETLVKAWRRLDTYDGRATFRAWIYRIATNTCLDALRARKRRFLPQDLVPPCDPASPLGEQALDIPWLEPYPDALLPNADPEATVEQRESVRLAFVRALQVLPARQRAVLILRDVLDWSATEVAAMLDTSVAAVKSALQRARGVAAQPALSEASMDLTDRKAQLAARYVQAWEAGDIDAIVSMLTEDAIQAMPPSLDWMSGREALRIAYQKKIDWGGEPRPGVFRVLPTAVNGQLAFAEYYRTASEVPYRALALTVATPNRDWTLIAEKTSFVQPDLLTAFGLPASLD